MHSHSSQKNHSCSHDHENHKGHSHSHGFGHSHAIPSDFKSFKWAIAINFFYVVIQVIFAIRSNSNSLFADAAHNFGDVLGLAFTMVSAFLHEKSATKKYSYGFKKTTILAAISNALILMFTCGFIGYDCILKFIHPDHVIATNVMIVAACGVILNGASALFFMKNQHDLNIKSAFLHLAYDALISLGVVIGAGVIYFTGWVWLDPLLGVLIIVIILLGTLSLLKNSVRLVMDGVPPGLDSEEIQDYLLEKPYVLGVHDLHVWALSTTENILTAHLLVDSKIYPSPEVASGSHYDRCIQDLSETLEKKFNIHHVTLQLEESDCEKRC